MTVLGGWQRAGIYPRIVCGVEKIGEVIGRKNLGGKELYEEADAWMEDACRACGCVTILGI